VRVHGVGAFVLFPNEGVAPFRVRVRVAAASGY